MAKKIFEMRKAVKQLSQEKEPGLVSYRLKCSKTANGLSHYLMYGDLSEDKSLL